MRVVRAARFLGSVLGLFVSKLGEELDVSVLWVELRLNRDHRFSRDIEMPTLDISFKRIMMQLLGWLFI